MKRILGTAILLLLLLTGTKKIVINSKEYSKTVYNDKTTKTDVSSALTSFGNTLNIDLFNTNKFNCTVTNNKVSCASSSYQKVGLFSYPEYNLIGGASSYLYNPNSY